MAKGKQAKTAQKSKNDPTARGTGAKQKFYSGKPVKPTRYVGTQLGHGSYISASYEDGKLAIDPSTKLPVKWKAI